MVRIHYDVDPELHARAKAAAALEQVSLKAFVERALQAEVEKVEKKRRKR